MEKKIGKSVFYKKQFLRLPKEDKEAVVEMEKRVVAGTLDIKHRIFKTNCWAVFVKYGATENIVVYFEENEEAVKFLNLEWFTFGDT